MDEPLRMSPLLVAIAGPTGSGKSDLALKIAERFGGEILNCDSVQVYRHFNIGTAKTPETERCGIPHHLIDAFNPDEVFTAGDFSRVGRRILHDIAGRGRLPVVAGGTGFYLRALIDGLAPGPQRDAPLRARLARREEKRPGSIHRLLRRFDPVTAARIHPNDIPKAMRALEICLAARRPAAEVFQGGRDALEGFQVLKIGLFPDRELLYRRLEARFEKIFADGLIEETASILAMGYPETAKPFEAIGYKQALQVLKGELSLKDASFYARRDTRRYAKRQMTWFRQEPGLEILRGFGNDPDVRERAARIVNLGLKC
ncbi:MAG TPA: tRNA (adenosine(37)-N6)-dimethylallyltransferase MiaA [Bryobacteraceae bacterium]|nr:tRNA (adenosine(37)-N6)-dimethylallyltransferase MiaA [Bryobacteraceae bacterium]